MKNTSILWLRAFKHVLILVLAVVMIGGCAAPVVQEHHIEDAESYATVYGSYAFLGFGWGACAVREIDGKDLGFPYPYAAKVQPGKHTVTFWCAAVFATSAGGDNYTYALNMKPDHSYKLSFFNNDVVELQSGEEIPEIQRAALYERQRQSAQIIANQLTDPEKLLFINSGYWFIDIQGHSWEFYKAAGYGEGKEGDFVLTNLRLIFYVQGGESIADLEMPYDEVANVNLEKQIQSRLLVITGLDGRHQTFQLWTPDYTRVEKEKSEEAYAILRQHVGNK